MYYDHWNAAQRNDFQVATLDAYWHQDTNRHDEASLDRAVGAAVETAVLRLMGVDQAPSTPVANPTSSDGIDEISASSGASNTSDRNPVSNSKGGTDLGLVWHNDQWYPGTVILDPIIVTAGEGNDFLDAPPYYQWFVIGWTPGTGMTNQGGNRNGGTGSGGDSQGDSQDSQQKGEGIEDGDILEGTGRNGFKSEERAGREAALASKRMTRTHGDQREFGAGVYKYTDSEGRTRFGYSDLKAGNARRVILSETEVLNSLSVDGAEVVAFAHSHPNNSVPSPEDYFGARIAEKDAYVGRDINASDRRARANHSIAVDRLIYNAKTGAVTDGRTRYYRR
jgi:hypothetical protein